MRDHVSDRLSFARGELALVRLGVMAIVVIVGYWHVRRTLRKRERIADTADADARRRAEGKHHKTRHSEVE